jgi:hypothetical protein
MPNSKARDLASLLSGSGTGTIAPALVSDQDNTSTGYFDLPSGTTAERPVNPQTGMIRFNTTINLSEYYDGTGWKAIDAPPSITEITPTAIDSDDGTTTDITITGQFFGSGASVQAIASNGTTVDATTVVFNSQSEVVATFQNASFSNALEPYDIKVTNPSGLSASLDDQISVDANPVWNTSSGTLATISDVATGTHATVSATDPDSDSITYAVASGFSLPSGLSINASTGAISGDPTNVNSDTQTTFKIDASTPNGTTLSPSFNINVLSTRDGTSVARAFTLVQNADPYVVNGNFYYVHTSSGGTDYVPFYVFNGYAYALVGCRYQSGSKQTSVNTDGQMGTIGNAQTFHLGTTKIRHVIAQTGLIMVPQQASGALQTQNSQANLFRSSSSDKRIDSNIFTYHNAGEGSNGTSVRGIDLSTYNPNNYPTNNWYDLDDNSHEGGNQILSYFGGGGSIGNGGVEPLGLRWSNNNGAGYQDGSGTAGNDVTGGARNLSDSTTISLFLLAR